MWVRAGLAEGLEEQHAHDLPVLSCAAHCMLRTACLLSGMTVRHHHWSRGCSRGPRCRPRCPRSWRRRSMSMRRRWQVGDPSVPCNACNSTQLHMPTAKASACLPIHPSTPTPPLDRSGPRHPARPGARPGHAGAAGGWRRNDCRQRAGRAGQGLGDLQAVDRNQVARQRSGGRMRVRSAAAGCWIGRKSTKKANSSSHKHMWHFTGSKFCHI